MYEEFGIVIIFLKKTITDEQVTLHNSNRKIANFKINREFTAPPPIRRDKIFDNRKLAFFYLKC